MDNSSQTPGPSGRKPTPAEARRAAKNERRRAGQEQARAAAAARKRRNAGLFAAVGVIAIVAIVVLVTTLSGSSPKKTNAASTNPSASASAPASTPASAAPSPSAGCPSASPKPPVVGPAAPSASADPADFPPLLAGQSKALKTQPVVKKGTGTITKLTSKTLIQGTGPVVKTCDSVTVNYVGATYKDGKVFDSSWSRKQTFTVDQVGYGQVIAGWNQGLVGVKVGSRIQLDIPASLAYGDTPSDGSPAGTLRFVIDVLSTTPQS